MKKMLIFKDSLSISIDASTMSDFIFIPIAIICIIYTAIALFNDYMLFFKLPKRQSKWLKERFPEQEDQEIK
jgi:hypothetical protein